MTDVPLFDNLQVLQAEFLIKKESQLALCLKHEANENYGLAYLAFWAVGEHFAKHLAHVWQRDQLKSELTRWQSFLNDSTSSRPSDILVSSFKLACAVGVVIPSVKILKLALPVEVAPSYYEMIDSERKYRRRRNTIAHSGESVTLVVYEEFKALAIAAHKEIEDWLASQLTARIARLGDI